VYYLTKTIHGFLFGRLPLSTKTKSSWFWDKTVSLKELKLAAFSEPMQLSIFRATPPNVFLKLAKCVYCPWLFISKSSSYWTSLLMLLKYHNPTEVYFYCSQLFPVHGSYQADYRSELSQFLDSWD